MQLKPRKQGSSVNLKPGNSGATNTSHTTITHRREIPVAPGQTVVVTPRLSPLYKTVIWFSFILNALLLVLLLTAASMGFRMYREYRAATAQISDRLNTDSVAGQTVKSIVTGAQQGPAGSAQATDQAVALAQQKVGVLTGAVEGLQNATIKATIPIDQQVPVTLQVGVDQDTSVVLTQPVALSAPAHIAFPGGGAASLICNPASSSSTRTSSRFSAPSSTTSTWAGGNCQRTSCSAPDAALSLLASTAGSSIAASPTRSTLSHRVKTAPAP